MYEAIGTQALVNWIRECVRVVALNKEVLNELDSASGDADHGANLERGFSALLAVIDGARAETPAELLKRVGIALVSKVGGSSGALYGTFFLRMAASAGEHYSFDAPAFGKALRAAGQGIVERGKVKTGDKTMYDALAPAIDALDSAMADRCAFGAALNAAAVAAESGRDATAAMIARRGRASYMGERTIGQTDAGATSMALMIRAAATTLGNAQG